MRSVDVRGRKYRDKGDRTQKQSVNTLVRKTGKWSGEGAEGWIGLAVEPKTKFVVGMVLKKTTCGQGVRLPYRRTVYGPGSLGGVPDTCYSYGDRRVGSCDSSLCVTHGPQKRQKKKRASMNNSASLFGEILERKITILVGGRGSVLSESISASHGV